MNSRVEQRRLHRRDVSDKREMLVDDRSRGCRGSGRRLIDRRRQCVEQAVNGAFVPIGQRVIEQPLPAHQAGNGATGHGQQQQRGEASPEAEIAEGGECKEHQ